MKCLFARPLFWLLAGIGFAAFADPSGLVRVGGERGSELRVAVEAHRAARRADVQHEDVLAGRRLTAQERAELRLQLRRQWAAAPRETAQTVQSQSVERLAPVSALPGTQRH